MRFSRVENCDAATSVTNPDENWASLTFPAHSPAYEAIFPIYVQSFAQQATSTCNKWQIWACVLITLIWPRFFNNVCKFRVTDSTASETFKHGPLGNTIVRRLTRPIALHAYARTPTVMHALCCVRPGLTDGVYFERRFSIPFFLTSPYSLPKGFSKACHIWNRERSKQQL